jgi:hypothetical protein
MDVSRNPITDSPKRSCQVYSYPILDIDLTPVGGPTSQRELTDCKGRTASGAGGR